MGRMFRDGWLAFLLPIIFVCLACAVAVGEFIGDTSATVRYHVEQAERLHDAEAMGTVDDVGIEERVDYAFDEAKDMQNPELPTGCEATALSTLLRMNGVEASKTDVAERMPKGDGGDFVNKFWGDPTSEHGWSCMAPCVVETAKRFIPTEKTVVDLTGTPLVYLPAPCEVWVTMHMEEPIKSEYEQAGYELLWNTHCVVLVYADEATVTVIDPLDGLKTYPFSKFNTAYMANGKQAVYIADMGYMPELR